MGLETLMGYSGMDDAITENGNTVLTFFLIIAIGNSKR